MKHVIPECSTAISRAGSSWTGNTLFYLNFSYLALCPRIYQIEKCISPSHLGKPQVQKDLESSEMLIKLGFPCFQNYHASHVLYSIPSHS